MPFNPYQFIQMIKGGQNPQQLVMQLLENAADNAMQTQTIINQLRPSPAPAYVVPNPYCNCGNGYGYNYNNCSC